MSKYYILNFTAPSEAEDLLYYFEECNGQTNIDILTESFETGLANWSIPKYAEAGDIAFFMCASSSPERLTRAASQISGNAAPRFSRFVADQKKKYHKSRGALLGYGRVCSEPEFDPDSRRWYADLDQLRRFDIPVYYNEIKSFIHLNSFGSVTVLTEAQRDQLKLLIALKNSDCFEDFTPVYTKDSTAEHEAAVRVEQQKPDEELEADAERTASKPSQSTVLTTVYHRSASVAALAKRRANGVCQLCGQKAPFQDQNGDPYLECHHVDWLSEGGIDSKDNCVALCPNCHRRMHIVNSPEDRNILRARLRALNHLQG